MSLEVKIGTVACLSVTMANGKDARLLIDSDTPLGVLHDALMAMKGTVVNKMVAAQKEEQAASDAQANASAVAEAPPEKAS